MLHSPHRTPERILAMGPPGTGKTRAWLSIARLAKKTGSDARFYVIDSDGTVDRLIDEEFPELGEMVVAEYVETWPEYAAALEKFQSDLEVGDWLVVDMITPAWDAIQTDYLHNTYGWKGTRAEYFADLRAKGKDADGLINWSVVNGEYKPWQQQVLVSLPMKRKIHSFVTAGSKVLSKKDLEDKQTKLNYGPAGVKPEGQKQLGHLPHTVLYFTARKVGDWRIDTVKDRGREPHDQTEMKDFALTYLLKTAKWVLK
jgi:AAA domain-containing protein